MQKLSIEVLERMLSAKLTRKEVDFILYIAQYQDEFGKAEGIYYKDICEAVDLSIQGFYDCRTSLEEKGIIKCEKCNYYDTDITILDNCFMGKDNFGRGYVSLHCNMVRSAAFKKLKAGAKLMALYLMREWKICNNKTQRTAYRMKKETFIQKFTKPLGITARTARRYLGTLDPFLSTYLEDGKMYYFTFKKNMLEQDKLEESENGELREHVINTACRRNRIKNNDRESINNIDATLRRYNKSLRKIPDMSLSRIVTESLEHINESIKNKYKWKRYLKPTVIHSLIKVEIKTAMI